MRLDDLVLLSAVYRSWFIRSVPLSSPWDPKLRTYLLRLSTKLSFADCHFDPKRSIFQGSKDIDRYQRLFPTAFTHQCLDFNSARTSSQMLHNPHFIGGQLNYFRVRANFRIWDRRTKSPKGHNHVFNGPPCSRTTIPLSGYLQVGSLDS